MSDRWEYPNFDPWEWDEFGENDLTKEIRKIVHGEVPLDKWVLHLALMDILMSHSLINNLREKKIKARIRKAFHWKGNKS